METQNREANPYRHDNGLGFLLTLWCFPRFYAIRIYGFCLVRITSSIRRARSFRYDNHCRANERIPDGVAALKLPTHNTFRILVRGGILNGVVELRIEGLAHGLDWGDLELHESVQKLLVDI